MIQTHLWITDIDPCIHTWPALYLGHKIPTLYRHLSKHLSKHLSSYIIDRSGGVPALVNKRWHSQESFQNLVFKSAKIRRCQKKSPGKIFTKDKNNFFGT